MNTEPKLPETEEMWRAVVDRDGDYDGVFFTAVKTTGIFCRPICPARKPLRENVEFFRGAREALSAGYRPCLRCRPETAPGSPAWRGAGATVSLALRLISETATEGESVEVLAARLGVGTRHLRRMFNEHLGAPPKAIAQTERFAIARQLLIETDMPITQVALAWSPILCSMEPQLTKLGSPNEESSLTRIFGTRNSDMPREPLGASGNRARTM